MNKFTYIEKVYQVLEITNKNLIQIFLDYSIDYIRIDLYGYEKIKEILTSDNISKLQITTYDIINDGFFIKFVFNDNIDRHIGVDQNIIMEYLMDNKLIEFNPNTLILSKMDLLDRRIKDFLLKFQDIDELRVLIVKENLVNKLVEFGFKEENIVLINDYEETKLDLIYIEDSNNLEKYCDIIIDLINKGVYLLALKDGVNFISNLNIKLNYELTNDVILLILNDEQYKYDLDLINYHGVINRKRTLEDFKKIVNDLKNGEPEICLKVGNEKYWIVKYKDYITLYHNNLENEVKFKDINDLIDNNKIFDFKNNWDLIDSIVLDEWLDL